MNDATCKLDGCDKPRYQRRSMCASHTMKLHRYGDPYYKAPAKYEDLTGRSFGLLTVVERSGTHWVCVCECGKTAKITAGCLNRGDSTCGDRTAHRRMETPTYLTMHRRLKTDFSEASAYPCADCGDQAAHWSYDNADPNELTDEATGLRYSTDRARYSPRCVPCHGRFDADHRREQAMLSTTTAH